VTRLLAFGYVLSSVAVALAWAVARRNRDHQPVAWLLTCGLATDLARRLLHLAILGPAHALFDPEPLTGSARIAGHLDSAIFLAWPATFVAVAVVVFRRRRPWAVGAIYASTVG